jgi:hypothetical protein
MGDTKPAVVLIVSILRITSLYKAKAATVRVAARMDFGSTEILRSLVQIVQMKLVRRARYCAPIAKRKPDAAEVSSHPVFTIYPYLAAMQLESTNERPFGWSQRKGVTANCSRHAWPRYRERTLSRDIIFSNPTYCPPRHMCVAWSDSNEIYLSGRACVSGFCFDGSHAGICLRFEISEWIPQTLAYFP